MGDVALIPHDAGKQTVLPLPSCGVDVTEQFVVCHGFRVQIRPDGFPFQVLVCSEQDLAKLCFARTCVTDNEYGMTDSQQLLELYNLAIISDIRGDSVSRILGLQ